MQAGAVVHEVSGFEDVEGTLLSYEWRGDISGD